MRHLKYVVPSKANVATIVIAHAFVCCSLLTSGTSAQEQETVSGANIESAAITVQSDAGSKDSDVEDVVDPRAANWIKFQSLRKQWRSERGATSSITAMSTLPAYMKIIGMGDNAIPLILAQLRSEGNEPDQWFWALKVITEADPVRPEDQGNFRAMAHAWLAWGESEGYAG